MVAFESEPSPMVTLSKTMTGTLAAPIGLPVHLRSHGNANAVVDGKRRWGGKSRSIDEPQQSPEFSSACIAAADAGWGVGGTIVGRTG